MFRITYLTLLLAFSFFIIGGSNANAQTGQVRGTVVMANADGTKTPVVGASVETFRTDINSQGPTAKTNKKGEFVFAGLQLGGAYTLSVSGEGIAPQTRPNVKAGDENITITVTAGDGRKLTETEIKEGAKAPAIGNIQTANPDSGKMSEEQKKKLEEYNKKKAENEKIQNAGAIVQKASKEGNDAFNSKDYNLAISKFDEGVAADPDFVGSAPTLLINKSIALRGRAVETFNQNLKNTDATAKREAMQSVKKDLADSVESLSRAWNVIKNAPASDIAQSSNVEADKTAILKGSIETFRRMLDTKQVDATKFEIAKTLIPEYLNIEKEGTKKVDAQVILGNLYLENASSGNAADINAEYDSAIVEFKKALTIAPNNIDSLLNIGLSYVSKGANNKDSGNLLQAKSDYQEAVNYLQRFYDVAPDNNQYKAGMKETIDEIKKEQNVTPQKVPGKKKG